MIFVFSAQFVTLLCFLNVEILAIDTDCKLPDGSSQPQGDNRSDTWTESAFGNFATYLFQVINLCVVSQFVLLWLQSSLNQPK